MTLSTQPRSLTADEIRQSMNHWSQEAFFRLRRLGDRIAVKETINHSCYTLRLKTQCEKHQVSMAQVPYEGGPVDSEGEPPGFWDIPVSRPVGFEERQEKIALPHTEQIVDCSQCAGTGSVSCTTCRGSGKINCPVCGGQGFIQDDRNWPPTWTSICPATACNRGEVECPSCNGTRQQVCTGCAGHCRVKSYKELTVEFHTTAAEETLSTANGLGDQTLNANGGMLIDQRFISGEKLTGLPAELVTRVTELLERAHTACGSDQRVLFQHVQAEEVPVCEVVYEYCGPPERRLWIYGQERQVFAPGAPKPWFKITSLCVGVLLAVVGAVWIGVSL